jgi:hypothetical protein
LGNSAIRDCHDADRVGEPSSLPKEYVSGGYIGLGDDSMDDSSLLPPVSVVLFGGLGILIAAYMLSGVDSKASIAAAGKVGGKKRPKRKR